VVLVAQPSEITPVAMSWVALCSTLAVLAFLILFAVLTESADVVAFAADEREKVGTVETCLIQNTRRCRPVAGRVRRSHCLRMSGLTSGPNMSGLTSAPKSK
jgi:hypothetical protein